MKTAGLLLLSIVPILFSYFLGEEIRQKQNLRKNTVLFFQHILFQIENFNRDQKEIFFSFDNKVLEKAGFLPSLREEVESAPCGALGRIIKKHLPSFGFSPQMADLVQSTGDHFGTQGKESQINELYHTIDQLKKENEKEKTETENKIRISRMVGITVGIGIFILML